MKKICPKCHKGHMKPGQFIGPNMSFRAIIALNYIDKPKLMRCMKCSECGYSEEIEHVSR